MANQISIKIYQLKIALDEFVPIVWRRVFVPSNMHLLQIHTVIQIAMGWDDHHLHQFKKGKERFTLPEFEEGFHDLPFRDETEVTIADVLKKKGQKLSYEYDYGDNWLHTLTLESIKKFDPYAPLPYCFEGANACPPENCGGTWGYGNFLQAIHDPTHERHEELLQWVGGHFDSRAFDIDLVNKQLGRYSLWRE